MRKKAAKEKQDSINQCEKNEKSRMRKVSFFLSSEPDFQIIFEISKIISMIIYYHQSIVLHYSLSTVAYKAQHCVAYTT